MQLFTRYVAFLLILIVQLPFCIISLSSEDIPVAFLLGQDG